MRIHNGEFEMHAILASYDATSASHSKQLPLPFKYISNSLQAYFPAVWLSTMVTNYYDII